MACTADFAPARMDVNRSTRAGRIAAAIAVTTAILVAAPVISIIALAMQPAPDVWRDLIAYVLPRALLDTALLLGGVGALALAIGAGTAWLISLHDFRGRRLLLWLMPLPLAIPTYLAAYVYVDLFEPLGLVHRTLAIWFPLRDAVARASQSALAARRDHRHRPRALPLRLSLGADHVPVPERRIRRGRAHARRQPLDRCSGASRCRWRGRRWRSASRWYRWKR